MTTLEKILQDIEECRIIASLDGNFNSSASFKKCEEIIKKHLSCENHTETTRRQQDNGWIPCSERMPETGKHVLVSFKCSGFIPVIAFLSESKRWIMLQGANGFHDITNAVSAWRPLPEPYKPHAESSDGKRMREREEFFTGNDFLTKRFMEVK